MTEKTEARKAVEAFLKEQAEKGVKRNEIARSLWNKGYSCTQGGIVMGVHPKTFYAMTVNLSKAGKEKKAVTHRDEHLEIKNFLKGKGGAVAFNTFYKNVILLVGKPAKSTRRVVAKTNIDESVTETTA